MRKVTRDDRNYISDRDGRYPKHDTEQRHGYASDNDERNAGILYPRQVRSNENGDYDYDYHHMHRYQDEIKFSKLEESSMSTLQKWMDWRVEVNNAISEQIETFEPKLQAVASLPEFLPSNTDKQIETVISYSVAPNEGTNLYSEEFLQYGIPRIQKVMKGPKSTFKDGNTILLSKTTNASKNRVIDDRRVDNIPVYLHRRSNVTHEDTAPQSSTKDQYHIPRHHGEIPIERPVPRSFPVSRIQNDRSMQNRRSQNEDIWPADEPMERPKLQGNYEPYQETHYRSMEREYRHNNVRKEQTRSSDYKVKPRTPSPHIQHLPSPYNGNGPSQITNHHPPPPPPPPAMTSSQNRQYEDSLLRRPKPLYEENTTTQSPITTRPREIIEQRQDDRKFFSQNNRHPQEDPYPSSKHYEDRLGHGVTHAPKSGIHVQGLPRSRAYFPPQKVRYVIRERPEADFAWIEQHEAQYDR